MTEISNEELAARLEGRSKTMAGARPVGASDGDTYTLGYYGRADADLDRLAASRLRAGGGVTEAMVDAALAKSSDKKLNTLTNSAAMREILTAALSAKNGSAG